MSNLTTTLRGNALSKISLCKVRTDTKKCPISGWGVIPLERKVRLWSNNDEFYICLYIVCFLVWVYFCG